MGKKVLEAASDSSSPFLRTYAHCSKGRVSMLITRLCSHDFLISLILASYLFNLSEIWKQLRFL